MRNIFDQYGQWENRVTHALMCALGEDSRLLRNFLRKFGVGQPPKRVTLKIEVQQLPGEPQLEEAEAGRRGIPDGWVYTDTGWSLVIESKVKSQVETDQLRRHLQTAERRGFKDAQLLVLTVHPYSPPTGLPIIVHTWREVYVWLRQEATRSDWARRVAEFFEVAEVRMIQDGYLKEGTMTEFAGFPFGLDTPFNYGEAKRVLRLALEALRADPDLKKMLDVDPAGDGRSAITGQKAQGVWDVIPLRPSRGEDFVKYPHLTLGILGDRVEAMVTMPNSLRADFRGNLRNLRVDGFLELLCEVEQRMQAVLRRAGGASPRCVLAQRHYPTRSSAASNDAMLNFDLRTAIERGSQRKGAAVKRQPQWAEAAFRAWSEKKSNMQIQLGAHFPYRPCPELKRPDALRLVKDTWLACEPLLTCVLGQH